VCDYNARHTAPQRPIAKMIGVQKVRFEVLYQSAQEFRTFSEMLFTLLHPIQSKRGRNIVQVRQALHPHYVLWHWDLAKTHQCHAKAPPDQTRRQLAGIRPDSVHGVGRDQYVHSTIRTARGAPGLAIFETGGFPIVRRNSAFYSICDAYFLEEISPAAS